MRDERPERPEREGLGDMIGGLLETLRKYFNLRSLRMRVFIITFLVGIIPSMVLHMAIMRDYEKRAVEVRMEEVRSQLRSLANHLVNSGYMDGESSALINAELAEFSVLYDGRLLVINDHLRVIKDTYSVSEGKTIVSEDVIACLTGGGGGAYSRYDNSDGYIESVTPIIATDSMEETSQDTHTSADLLRGEAGTALPEQDGGEESDSGGEGEGQSDVRGVMLASVSTASIRSTQEILGRKALKMELVMVLLVFSLALLISSLFVQPFEKLSRDIGAVRMGFSSDPVQAPAMVETEHIADAFNQVLRRANALDASRQEFVSNVSHELKTPMTSMKVLADSLLMEENASPEMYREFLQDIANEIDRENKIISELLTLVRMDRKDAELNIANVDVNKMVEEVLGRVHPQARARGIELTLISERQVDAELDETKMAMVITNLVENAVKYNRDGGSVTVTIDAGLRNFSISVADTGIGIPEESLPQIFDRFYRVDKSRSRAVGGTGLGLSIARSVVLQHHGTLEVQSRLGVGTTFIMKIPILYVEQPAAATAENSRRSGRRAPARRTGFLQSIFGGRGRRSSAASSKKKSGRTASAGRSTKGTAAASSAGRSTTAVSAGRRASGTAAGRTAAGKTAAAGKARTGSSAGSTAGRTASKSGTAAKNVKKTGAGNVMPTVGAAGSSDGRARRTGKGRTNRRG